MATLTSETEQKGLTAYEQARAFERLREWRLPASYAFFIGLPLAMGAALWVESAPFFASLNFGLAVILAAGMVWHWQRLKALYSENTRFLRELEQLHGDALPWIRVEQHMAALDRLKRELAEEGRES